MTTVSERRRILRVGQVREANRATILRLLRRHRHLSRAELARRTGLSEASICRIVKKLLEGGLLVECGEGYATGGRPAVGLELDEARFRAVGVSIQNWETRVSLGTVSGRILNTEQFRTPATPEKTLAMVAENIERLSAGETLAGVGVSTHGLVTPRTGVAELGNMPGWVHVEIRDYLAARVGGPVYVENNVRAAALAEYVCGGTDIQGAHCLLFVLVDEGVGMGIVLEGRVYRGPRMAAGEIGQMVIADQRGAERHNAPGCLEMLAADPATCQRYAALAGIPEKTSAVSSTQQVRQICDLAMHGDEGARDALIETARCLGIGIASMVWALDADAVVIGGAITEAWPLVSAAIRDQFPEGPEFLNFRNLVLRPSTLAGEASIIGAITLPFIPLFWSEEALA